MEEVFVNILALMLGAILLCSVTPIPAMACFYAVWHPKRVETFGVRGKLLLLVPATVFPLAVLALHAATSEPHWKVYGHDSIYYVALGSVSWIYFTPFVMANYLIARTMLNTDYVEGTILPLLGLVTCILICLFFAAGNLHVGAMSLFPLSAGVAYSYGLYLFLRLQGLPQRAIRHMLLIGGWFCGLVTTAFFGIVRTKQIVAQLPDEAQSCFIVTAASRGHRAFVGSNVDDATGQLINDQLRTFRLFECWITLRAPRTHKVARSIYNCIAPPVARLIVFQCQADVVYILLKPAEWTIRLLMQSRNESDTINDVA